MVQCRGDLYCEKTEQSIAHGSCLSIARRDATRDWLDWVGGEDRRFFDLSRHEFVCPSSTVCDPVIMAADTDSYKDDPAELHPWYYIYI